MPTIHPKPTASTKNKTSILREGDAEPAILQALGDRYLEAYMHHRKGLIAFFEKDLATGYHYRLYEISEESRKAVKVREWEDLPPSDGFVIEDAGVRDFADAVLDHVEAAQANGRETIFRLVSMPSAKHPNPRAYSIALPF